MKSKNVKTKTLRYFFMYRPKLIQCFLVYVKTSINQRKDNGDLKATRKVMKRKIEMLLMQQ